MVGGVLLWAPGVKVISIKSHGDHFAALDWVIANAEKYKIAAVSLSFGQQWFPRSQADPSNCNSLGEGDWTSRFKLLRDNGVIPVVAAMNEGNPGNVGLPACNSYAVSVGSHFVGAPKLHNVSNVSPQLTLVGPSGYSTATNEYLKTWDQSSGTSAAAPVVAAMFAIGRQAKPSATSDELIRVARSSATRIDDLLVKDLRVVQFDKFIEELVTPSPSATSKTPKSKVIAQPCKKVGIRRVVGGRVQQCRRVKGQQVWTSSR
jgi:subtilisin family serine protease